MSDATVFVVRNDENSEYDRAQAAAYVARLKETISKDKSNPSLPVVLTREVSPVGKMDRTHIEIVEVAKQNIADQTAQGFTQA